MTWLSDAPVALDLSWAAMSVMMLLLGYGFLIFRRFLFFELT
jgi:hypothetical protein